MKINTDTAVEIANRLCAQMHQVAREDPSKRGDFEVSWIAGCVLAARFYADAMGLSERMPMSDRLAELLKLASNDSGDTSDDKPPGVRVGDICSNGWASNRNPLKLFMYLGMSHDSFRGINIDGKSAGPVRKGNAVKIVLPRDTPGYWQTWELLAKQLPLLCLAVLCLSGCLTAAKIGEWQRAVYGWGMDPGASKPCQVASAEASAYL
ncbi:MAG: hypothetical protein E6Q97_28490, partial [Desulfurellales bacterium]